MNVLSIFCVPAMHNTSSFASQYVKYEIFCINENPIITNLFALQEGNIKINRFTKFEGACLNIKNVVTF